MTPEQASLELIRRKNMRDSLIGFAQNVDIPGAPVKDDQALEEFDRLMMMGKPIETGLSAHHILLMNKLQEWMETPYGRGMVFMPPGAAKSTYGSVVAPVWFMGKYPGSRIILTSYGTDLAKKHGTKARALVRQKAYQEAFGCTLSKETGAREMWALAHPTNPEAMGSEYMSGGLLSGITGNRANGVIIDDPIKGRQEADSPTVRQRTIEAYEDDLRTRFVPGAWMVIIQCMVGETPVLMSDGTEKSLRDIRKGDRVATFNEGHLARSTVTDWRSSGRDKVFRIKMTSGRMVRANGRHPFLVEQPEGALEWIRLKELKLAQKIVVLKDSGGSGKEKYVKEKVVTSQSVAGVFVPATTTSGSGLQGIVLHRLIQNLNGLLTSSIATALQVKNTAAYWMNKMKDALFVGNGLKTQITPHTGGVSFALTTAMTLGRSEDCSVMPVTLSSKNRLAPKYSKLLSNTSDFTTERVVSIEPDGIEEVFDLQIERTENFIANGLVVHNTRWHDEDLAGSLLPEDYDGECGKVMCRDGMVWDIINMVAKVTSEKMGRDDPLNRPVGPVNPGDNPKKPDGSTDLVASGYLWPEWFKEQHWAQYEPRPGEANSPPERTWVALYQGRPRPDTGNQFERDWVNWYTLGQEPKYLNVYSASDYSVSDGTGDFTEHGISGLDEKGHLWLLDWWYGQSPPDITIDALLHMCKRWSCTNGFDESGLIEKAIKPQFLQRQRQTGIFLSVDYLPTIGDKVARFYSFRGLASSGKLWIPRCPWGERLVNQLCAFPTKHKASAYGIDDGVDVCALFGRGLEGMLWSKERVPKQPKKGLVFGSWEWLCQGTEGDKKPEARLF